MTAITTTSKATSRVLLIGASVLALSVPASANDVLFSTSATQVQAGQRTTQTTGLLQIRLASGATVSITQGTQYTLNQNGSIDLHKGSITVTGAGRSATEVRMPGGTIARVESADSAASFSVAEDGSASGHTLTGSVKVGRENGRAKTYKAGDMWGAKAGQGPRRTIANAPQRQPGATTEPVEVATISGDAGPVNAALNGIPVTLGDGLAAAGASSDIIDAGRRVEAAVANPSIDRFPSGDLALLVAAAADLERAYGGAPFNAAQADIIRSYLRFLASGASGADFLSAYSAFTLGYLELLRAGGVPGGFSSGVATAADIDAYLAFLNRTGALTDLGAQDRALVDAYLAFIASGQDRDLFAASFTDLTAAYFAFLRAGGVPSEFTGASDEALAASIAFLQQSGLLVQLSAADQALIAAFLDNGGIAFAAQFQTALADYFAYLASGQSPSDYTALDQATVRAYLEVLSNTGLLANLDGVQAQFFADYLAFLRAGGDVDAFAGLPANVFAGYQTELAAYFAFLENGGIPSAYTPLSQEVIAQYIAALQQAGATQLFLGDLADFYEAYFAFLSDGGNPDNFAGLPVPPDFPAFAAALNAYAAFLSANGLPSDFTETDLSALREFFSAVEQSGQVDDLLGENAALLSAYFAFLASGGAPDGFTGLPVYLDYVAALNAYFAFLEAGNLPSEYTELDQATIQAYLAALTAAQGGLAGFGDLNDFFIEYFNFLLAGNDPDLFDGLPGMGGGNGGGDPGSGNNPTLVYTGGFTPQGTGIIGAGSWADGGRDPIDDAYVRDIRLLGPGPYDAILDENGGLEQYVFARQNFIYADRGTAQTVDISGNEDLLIGRWTNGTYQRSNGRGELFGYDLTANQGFHYLLANGFTGPADYPTGRVEYELLAATSPTLIDGSQAPGTFAADAAIIFGTSPAFAIEGSIGFADFAYNFATDGGVAGDGQAIFLPSEGNGNLGYFNVTAPGSRGSGFSGQITFQVQVPDAQASQFGTQYTASDFNLSDSSDQIAIVGAAIFGAVDGDSGNGGTGGGTGGDPVITTRSDVFSTIFYNAADNARGLGTATLSDGRLAGFTTGAGPVEPATAEIVEGGSNDDLAWGRWTNGTVTVTNFLSFAGANNNSAHVFSGSSPINLPTTGVVEYELIGSTSPTDNQGSAPGTITGDMAVSFAGPRHIGLELDMTVGGKTWSTATTGGVADPTQSEITLPFVQNPFELAAPNFTSSANACTTSCTATLSGRLFGDGAASSATAFLVNDTSGAVNTLAQGIAVFGATGTRDTGGGTGGNTGGGTGGGTGFTGTRDNQVYYAFLDGSLNTGFGGSVDFVDGQITGMSSLVGTVSSNDTTIVEATDLGEVAWARWTNGTVQTTSPVGNLDFSVGANGGYHVMAGEVTTSLPGGTVAYELIGGTSATDNAGSAPGTLTGDLAIAFGAGNLVGYDLTMAVGGRSWSISTNGGAADPASSDINLVVSSAGFTFGGSFANSIGTVTSTGDTCSISCFVNVSGTLYGDDAAYAALAMNVTDSGLSRVVAASGLAIFGQEGAASPTSVQAPSSAATDWSRWDVAASAKSDAPASIAPATMPTLEAVTARQATDRAGAIAEAEAMMGGMISWGGAQQ